MPPSRPEVSCSAIASTSSSTCPPSRPAERKDTDMTQTTTPSMDLDPERLDAFVGQFAGDLGAVLHCATVLIGDRLGLYRAMGDCQWTSAEELAERTGTHLRYVREWLAAQAASGYAEYDASSERFRLTPEQAFALTNEENPVFAPGGLQIAA